MGGGGGGGVGGGGGEGEGEVRGDWAYLPPEARARGSVGRAADVFALGVTLLQLATGCLERVHELPLRARLAAAGVAGAAAPFEGGSSRQQQQQSNHHDQQQQQHHQQQQQQQGLAGLLDARAGSWDAGAGERLLRAALLCCADAPEERPTAARAARMLAGLHAAAERAAERAEMKGRERAEQLAEAWAAL